MLKLGRGATIHVLCPSFSKIISLRRRIKMPGQDRPNRKENKAPKSAPQPKIEKKIKKEDNKDE
jgi:hypothetical protein